MKEAVKTNHALLPNGGPLRVLFVDNHALVRRGLRRILADAFPEGQSGEVSNVTEAMQAITAQAWGLVVLDLNKPGCSGLDALKQLKQAGNKTPVLVLSVHSEDQYAMRALKAGAAG